MFIGKVLSNSGIGTQAQLLAGMNWAITTKCEVISMSIGAITPPQPVVFGVHSEVAEHYGVSPDQYPPHATTLDYVVAAAGG